MIMVCPEYVLVPFRITKPLAIVRFAPEPDGMGEPIVAALSSAMEPLILMTFPAPGVRVTRDPVIMKISEPVALPAAPAAMVVLASWPAPPRTMFWPMVALPWMVRMPPARTKMAPPMPLPPLPPAACVALPAPPAPVPPPNTLAPPSPPPPWSPSGRVPGLVAVTAGDPGVLT